MIKIKNYTNEELNYIKAHYNNKTVEQLSKILNKKKGSISNVIRKLGLSKQKHNVWTDDEIAFLKQHYIDMSSYEISQHIEHSIDAINTQRNRLKLIRHEEWSNDEINFLKNNFIIMSHKEIADVLGRTDGAVRAKCFDLNLYKKEIPWTDYELEFVKMNYMEMKTKDIAKELNRTTNAIGLQASKLGLKKYPYTCDYNYFDVIDTEEKAYWLGFLTADGWINRNEKTNSGVVGCELQYRDLNHLKKFNKSVSGNYTITDRWRICNLSRDKEKKYHTCCIRIFSITMYNSLVKLGFSNNKSFDANIPSINDDLLRHFLRGYFDGDGCFTKTNKWFKVSFVTVSKIFNDSLVKLINIKGIKINERSYINEYGNKTYVSSINKYKDKVKFLDYIYKDANIYLDRKYKKYLKVKEQKITEYAVPRLVEMQGKVKSDGENWNSGMRIRVEG